MSHLLLRFFTAATSLSLLLLGCGVAADAAEGVTDCKCAPEELAATNPFTAVCGNNGGCCWANRLLRGLADPPSVELL